MARKARLIKVERTEDDKPAKPTAGEWATRELYVREATEHKREMRTLRGSIERGLRGGDE